MLVPATTMTLELATPRSFGGWLRSQIVCPEIPLHASLEVMRRAMNHDTR